MHIIGLLIAVIGGIAFWWWRLRMVSEAAQDIGDVAGRALGKYKRNKFRKKVESSPLEAVDDPAAAAVILMFAVAAESRPLDDEIESAIRHEVTQTMEISEPDEILTFAKWVSTHVVDANSVSLRCSKLWVNALSLDERQDFVEMIERICAVVGDENNGQQQIIRKLRERLGLLN